MVISVSVLGMASGRNRRPRSRSLDRKLDGPRAPRARGPYPLFITSIRDAQYSFHWYIGPIITGLTSLTSTVKRKTLRADVVGALGSKNRIVTSQHSDPGRHSGL